MLVSRWFGGWTCSYFARKSSASLRLVNLASVIALIASTYPLNVGDNLLEIGAFSRDMIAVRSSGFVKARYSVAFAPLPSAT